MIRLSDLRVISILNYSLINSDKNKLLKHFIKKKNHICRKFLDMSFDFKEIVTATLILFAVIDIVGSIPKLLICVKK